MCSSWSNVNSIRGRRKTMKFTQAIMFCIQGAKVRSDLWRDPDQYMGFRNGHFFIGNTRLKVIEEEDYQLEWLDQLNIQGEWSELVTNQNNTKGEYSNELSRSC